MRRSSDLADGHAELIEVIVEDDYGSRTRALECVREVFCSFATSDFGARRSGSRIQRIHQHLSPSPTCYISFSCTPTFSVMPPIGITTTLRRNGKLQSCEPCRKRLSGCLRAGNIAPNSLHISRRPPCTNTGRTFESAPAYRM